MSIDLCAEGAEIIHFQNIYQYALPLLMVSWVSEEYGCVRVCKGTNSFVK